MTMKTIDSSEYKEACVGCKLSALCGSHAKGNLRESCGVNLWAVLLAFILPMIGIVVLLTLVQGRICDEWAALVILLFLVIYYALLKLVLRYWIKRF